MRVLLGTWFALLVATASWGLFCTFILVASYHTKEWMLPAWWLVFSSALHYGAAALCVLAMV